MTVSISKREIHFGWEVFVGILVFVASSTWGIEKLENHYSDKLDKMSTQIEWIAAHDTLQNTRFRSLDTRLTAVETKQASTDAVITSILVVPRLKYFTERKSGGKLKFDPVK